MSMSSVSIVLGSLLGLVIASGLCYIQHLQAKITDLQYKITDLQDDIKEAAQAADEQVAQIETSYKRKLIEAQAQADANLKSVQDNYNRFISELDADRVRVGAAGSAKRDSAKAPAAPARACATGASQSHGANGDADKRASQIEADLLAVSRDCDALAVRYNTLLKLYQSYQNATNSQAQEPVDLSFIRKKAPQD